MKCANIDYGILIMTIEDISVECKYTNLNFVSLVNLY